MADAQDLGSCPERGGGSNPSMPILNKKSKGRFLSFQWTQDFAYAIGLLTADGNLSSDGRHIEFCSKDIENVVHFQRCLNVGTKISLKKRGTPPLRLYHRTQIGDVALYRFLQRIGLRPKKSRTLGSIMIPEAVFPDFLRGLWDGDGGFTTFRHPESRRLQWKARISSGSPIFLQWLQGVIEEMYGFSGKTYLANRVHQLVYHKGNALRLLTVMYYQPHLVCLTRKRAQAELLSKTHYEI